MPSLKYILTDFTVSNDFTNPQYVNSYIDCSGLSFATRFADPNGAYDDVTLTVNGSSLVNGTYSGDAPGTVSATYTISASPAQFTTAGEQTVTFTAEQTGAYGGSVTATKSVTVQSLSTIKNVYVFTADGRRAIWGTIEEAPPVTVTGVTTNIALKAQSQNSGTAIITYTDGTSASYSFTVNLTGAGRPVTCSAPGIFTYNHNYSYSASYEGWYYDYTEDGTTVSDILMAMVGGGAVN